VCIWDASSWQPLRTLLPDRAVLCLAWGTRRDGRPLLAAGGRHGEVWIVDAENWELLHTLRGEPDPGLSGDALVQAGSLSSPAGSIAGPVSGLRPCQPVRFTHPSGHR
jgi:hypothetical protein